MRFFEIAKVGCFLDGVSHSLEKRRGEEVKVTKPGGHLVWLDVCWPMHRKVEWVTVGRIAIVRSTNHRVRMATIFERCAA